eukprot:68326-Hanusia_phi.AAC.1
MGPPALGDVSATGNGPLAPPAGASDSGTRRTARPRRSCGPAYRLVGPATVTGHGYWARSLGIAAAECHVEKPRRPGAGAAAVSREEGIAVVLDPGDLSLQKSPPSVQ